MKFHASKSGHPETGVLLCLYLYVLMSKGFVDFGHLRKFAEIIGCAGTKSEIQGIYGIPEAIYKK